MNEETMKAAAVVKAALAHALDYVECITAEFIAEGGTYEEAAEHDPIVEARERYNAIARELGLEEI